jgi:hypothetical protein
MEHSHEDTQTTAEPAATNEPAGAAGPGSELLRDSGAGLSAANLAVLQRAAGNQSVLALLRSVAPPTGRRLAGEGDATAAGLKLVDDGAEAAAGRVPVGTFLDAVEHRICAVVDSELAGTSFSSAGCPWIAHWIAYYRGRSADEVQAALAQYAPGAVGARGLDDALDAIAGRLSENLRSWRASGTIPDVSQLPSVPGGGQAPAPIGIQREAAGAVRDELGPGRPLEPGVAARMGPLLGADVSHARVHSDELGARIAERHGAAAVAVGSHVAFARGTYEPGTPLGDALLAHELAHVAQYDETAVVAPAREAEREADAAGVAALAQRGVAALRRSVKSGLALRRCGGKEWPTTPGVFGKAPEKVRQGFDRDGNDPGKLPAVSQDKDTSRFSFDADGDQVKELNAEVTVMELHASGAAKRVKLVLEQNSSKSRLSGEFLLPDVDKGGGPPSVAISDVTDGQRPTKVALALPVGGVELQVQPAERFATAVRHRVTLTTHPSGPASPAVVAQAINYDFPPETAQINEVFTTADPSREEDKQPKQGFHQVGALWKVDVAVGAYGDRFRMSFRRVREGAPTIEMGLGVLAKGEGAAADAEDVALAGHAVMLEVSNQALAPAILKSDPTRLVLDLDGDGRADVLVIDKLTLPAAAKGGGDKDRDHELTISGSAVRSPARFSYPVRDGFIKAGEQKGAATDFSAASDLHAAGSLPGQEAAGVYDEKKGQILGELISTERTLAALRKAAVDEKLISEDLYKKWSQAEWDFGALAAYEAKTPPDDVVDAVGKSAVEFFDALEAETKRGMEDVEGADNATVAQKNPYTGTQIQLIWPGGTNDVRGPFLASLKAGRWKEAGKTYRVLVDGLDRWVANVNREKYGKADQDKPETQRAAVGERLTGLRRELRGLEGKNPTRVAAVLHMDEYFENMGDVQEVPLSLYYWKEGSRWYVKDLTTPDEAPDWHVSVREGETEPDERLFNALDETDHFPKGYIHWMLPSGKGGRARTTGPSKLKKWAGYIGMGAAAIGLGLVTFGTGTVAVAGGYILAGSAVLGAATAGYDLYEKGSHGTLRAGEAILDVAQIVSAVFGLAALRFGRILANVRTASAAGAAVEATDAIQLARSAFVPVRMIGGAADVVTLAVMSAELEHNVDRINKANLPDGERKRALALLFTQFAFTGGLTALSVKGLLPEMVGRGQDISIVRYGDKEFAIPQGQSVQGGAINESMLKLGDAPDAAAAKTHLDTMGKVGGKPGAALSEVEALRLQGASAPITVDPAGKVTSGPSAGTLADLIEKTQMANAAAAAHGVKVQYRLKISAAGPDGGSQVQVVAEAPTKSVPGSDVSTLQLFTNMSSGRAQQIASKAAEMKKLDPGSSIEILPDGRLRINAQADVGPEMLAKMKPDEMTALLQGTKKLAETGWSLDTLKKNEKGLYDALEGKVLKSGAFRLRIDAHKTQALKWAQDTLQLPTDLKENLGVLLGSADEGSLSRFFDIPNEGSQFSGKQDIPARSMAARIALEGKPKTLGDFINRYYYALGTLRRGRFAIKKPTEADEKALLSSYDTDPAMREAVTTSENAARLANAPRAGATFIKPGSSPADTVKTLRDSADELKFANTDTLTYHVRKHHNEMPKSEWAGQPDKPTTEIDAYLAEARKTLTAQPAEKVNSKPTQDGLGTVYTFERPKGPVKASGKQEMSRLMILVRFDGQAIILTYIP